MEQYFSKAGINARPALISPLSNMYALLEMPRWDLNTKRPYRESTPLPSVSPLPRGRVKTLKIDITKILEGCAGTCEVMMPLQAGMRYFLIGNPRTYSGLGIYNMSVSGFYFIIL